MAIRTRPAIKTSGAGPLFETGLLPVILGVGVVALTPLDVTRVWSGVTVNVEVTC